MDRFVLTDAQWRRWSGFVSASRAMPGAAARITGCLSVLWIARTGSPWRDLSRAFGHWSSVYTRFRDWTKADVWKRMLEAVSGEPDMEYAMVDAIIVKVRRHGQSAKGGLKARPSVVRKAA